MSKQENRGFTLHGFAWGCYNCCCSVCTGNRCPDSRKRFGVYKYHCAPCRQSNGEMHKVLECDFFQNKYTTPRRYKIRRRRHVDDLSDKLDKIMERLGISEDNSPGVSYAERLVDEYNKKIGGG